MSNYLDLTSELLQDLFNLYTQENHIFTYTFKREEVQEESLNPLDKKVSYIVTISNPTKQNPIPDIVYYMRVIFQVPSFKVLKNLDSISFVQHVQFLVEHRKEPFELGLNIEEGLMSTPRETIKQEFDLIALINQYLGREIKPNLIN